MGKRSKQRDRVAGKQGAGKKWSHDDAAEGAFHNPFAAALGGLRDDLPEGDAPAPAPTPEASASDDALPSRAVVRRERKGRGGKDVTLVELRGLPDTALPDWLTDCKRALGCGGTLEPSTSPGHDGRVLALQGDQRDRVRDWLAGRGVARVTVS